MKLVPASTFDTARLATLFEDGYAGYYVPVHVDEATLSFMVDAWDVDLDRSRVALEDDTPVGIGMLAVRGDEAWIGGLGVIPERRRNGVGRALMEAVLEDAPPSVSLEVIEQNEPAIRLYESLGFERTRVLEVWSLDARTREASARDAEPRPLGQRDLPWQRADRSLPNDYERIEVDHGAALIRARGAKVSVLQLDAADSSAAEELLAAARARGESLDYVNVPERDPASAALRALGGKLDLRQFEMRRPVSA